MCSGWGETAAALLDALASASVVDTPTESLAEELVTLRETIDRLEAQFLRRLEPFDRRGGGLADGTGSTASWLRWRCRLSGPDAMATVRCARRLADAVPATAAALAAGGISRRHAEVIAVAGADLPDAAVTAAEPALVEAAHRLDPDQLRRVTTHWRHTVDADRCLADGNVAHDRRYLHISSTFEGLVALDGLLDADAGAAVLAARRALRVRDRGCVFPGCNRPPPWTDAHHITHWANGGPTSLDNLVRSKPNRRGRLNGRRFNFTRSLGSTDGYAEVPC